MENECYTSEAGAKLAIELDIACTLAGNGSGGMFTMVHELCTARITDEGKVIGEVGGMLGGGVQIHDERDSSVWQLSALDIFKAYEAARAKQGTQS
jgi:hypothetical protein